MLIRNGLVLRPDGTTSREDVQVVDGRIGTAPDGTRETVIEATDMLVAPGLINTHCHSNENYLKGRFDNLPLELWMLFSYPVTSTPSQTPREIYVRTMLGCIEMLKTGCTAVVDFLYEMPEATEASVDAVLRAYRDSGMRVLLVLGYADKSYYETVPIAMDLLPDETRAEIDSMPVPSPEDNLRLADAIRRRWHGVDGRITVGLGPSGPQRCSDRQLEISAEYANRHDLRIHIHTLETKMQAWTGHRLYRTTIIEHLADLGFLSERVSLNHAVWLTEGDLDRVAHGGAMATHNLLSNLKLGSGISPVPAMLGRGIDVSLGTDGKSSNDSQNMYEVLKTVALLHKVQNPEFDTWLGAPDAWRMATVHGARSAGYGGDLGQIREGQRADLVLFDINAVPFVPLNVPLHHLVYCLPSSAIDTVIVEGEVVVRHGRLTRVDEAALLGEARELAAGYLSRYDSMRAGPLSMVPSVSAGYRRAVWQDVGVDRHIGRVHR